MLHNDKGVCCQNWLTWTQFKFSINDFVFCYSALSGKVGNFRIKVRKYLTDKSWEIHRRMKVDEKNNIQRGRIPSKTKIDFYIKKNWWKTIPGEFALEPFDPGLPKLINMFFFRKIYILYKQSIVVPNFISINYSKL